MKEFLIGFIFLVLVAIFTGIGLLCFPLLVALALFLRIIFIIIFLAVATWFLGKLIILIWEKIK